MKPSDPILDWQINNNFGRVALNELGLIPGLITSASPNNAYTQLNENATGGFVCSPDNRWELLDTNWLYFPGMPAMEPIAHAWLRHEQIYVYQYGFICIVQPDGAFTVGRLK